MTKIGIAGPIETAMLAEFLTGSLEGTPCGLGGISVTQLVRGLLLKGYHVSVYTLDKQVTEPVTLFGDRLTVYYGPFRLERRMRDFMNIERESIRRFIEADRPDLVHAHWTYEFALGALASQVPTIITVRDWAPAILRQLPDLYRVGRLIMSYATLATGKHVVANSPYIQRRVQRFFRRPVPVIPNAIEDSLFEGPRARGRSEDPIIVSVNNGFGRRKNVHVLLEAFRLIKARLPGCRLRLLGYGFGADEKAARWARARGLARGVEFEGYKPYDVVLQAIRAADVLIHPALEESFGMTLLEAMAKGTPVIGGRKSGAVPWVLNGGAAGLLADVTNPKAIAYEGIRLLTTPALWAYYSEAGFSYAWNNFRLSHITTRYLEQYHQLLPELQIEECS